MDYCHPCRRHLNGALACAGCGTPAPELIGPPAAGPERGDAIVGPSAHGVELPDPLERTSRRSPTPSGRTGIATGPATGPGARSRRAKKGRRRHALIGGVCLALTAGTWGLVELNQDDEGAATTVKEATSPEPVPAPDSTPAVEPPDEPDEPDDPDGPTAGPSVSARPAERSRKPVSDARAARTRTPSPTTTTEPSPAPPKRSGTPVSSAPGRSAKPSRPRLTPLPTPTPAPSEECERFLWWCV
ncbi:hypothetical protein ABZ348_06485 [Streptomyces sp. NPDC005963]|uniref:SCO2400 family protein n=1 Tax=Streptomyces sp. NPDC005963 TaxID=3156721 RepID=UPI0033DAD32C